MIWVILPSYNEEQSLKKLLPRLRETLNSTAGGYRVLVVDDGSQDGTARVAEQFAEEMPVILISHPVNQGLGVTIRDGLHAAAAQAQPSDVIAVMDADNTHDPSLIPPMATRLDQGCDIVIASRFVCGGEEHGLSLYRMGLSHAAGLLFRIVFHLPGVREYTCSYRVYRAELVQRAWSRYGEDLIQETGFVSAVELLVKLGTMAAKIDEYPLSLRYDLKEGASKMKVGRTVRRYFVFMYRYLRRS